MSRYSDSDIPDTLAPVGGWKNDTSAPPPAAPAVPTLAPLSSPQSSATTVAPPVSPTLAPGATPGAPKSRFDAATPAAPSRFSAPTPPPASPKLANEAPSHPGGPVYSKAGAYARGMAEPLTSARIATGVFAGLFLGGLVFAIWMVVYFVSGSPWSMLGSAAVGYTVGWAVFKGTGEGEETSCWISCFISLFYILVGVGLINYFYIAAWGFPNIVTLFFGVIALAKGVERGYRLPEVLAVETHA